jgi:Putative prokaryotic signal transducing protein
MSELTYEKVGEANNRAEAEIIEGFLEAEGIDVELVEESISRSAYAFPLTRIEIFVPKEKALQASNFLKEFDEGKPEEDGESK